MTVLAIIACVFGIAGVLFGCRCYYELWKWARQMQGARIAIAYKNKVKLQAPLVEWMKWCNQLDDDKDSDGRVVLRMSHMSVVITKKPHTATLRQRWQARKAKPQPRTASQIGTWNKQEANK